MAKKTGKPNGWKLIDIALGKTEEGKTASKEEALQTLKPEEKKEEVVVQKSILEPPPKEAIEDFNHKAYSLTYDESTKKYCLTTLEYKEDGTGKVIAKDNNFSMGLPEAHFKLGKIFLDHLAYTMRTQTLKSKGNK